MSDIKTAYGTASQTITITVASLANNAARESTAIDNGTTDKWLDALVQVQIRTGAGAPAGDQVFNIYAYGTVDPATPLYPDTVTGTDAAITLNNPTQLKLIGSIAVAAASTTYKSEPMSVAAAFGGILPTKWGIVIENKAGQTADATGSNHRAVYQGIYATGT